MKLLLVVIAVVAGLSTFCEGVKLKPQKRAETSCSGIVCRNGDGCIKKVDLCNGKQDCKDGSDEAASICGNSAKTIECEDGSKKWISIKQICDGRWDCTNNGEDESPALCGGKCASGLIACKDGSGCIPKDHLCDKEKQCKDGSDESEETCKPNAKNIECEDGSGVWIANSQICDGVKDCVVSGEDEDATLCSSKNKGGNKMAEREVTCKAGEMKCKDGLSCILPGQICDGKPQCNDGSDESAKTCGPNAKNIECEDGSGVWISMSQVCDGKKDCPSSGEDEAPQLCKSLGKNPGQ